MAHTKVTKTGTQNTGAVNTFSYSGSFDVFKATEVITTLDSVALTYTATTINDSASPREYSVDVTAKTIHIGGANLAGSNTVIIRPATDMGSPTPRAEYTPGASITSSDLNNNQLQLMRKAMEYDETKMSTTGGTMTGNLTMAADQTIIFEGPTDDAHETTLYVVDPTADRTVKLPNQSGTLPVLAVDSTTQITSTPEELNILDGVTATTAEINIIDGATASTAELNYVTGVTSSIQSQIDGKQPVDADLTALSSMQTGAAAKVALLTADEVEKIDGLTSSTTELNKLDGVTASTTDLNITASMTKQTTISDSDTSYPTSGAVVDYVATVIAPIGGLEVIADDESFPNTIPAAGVVISITDCAGLSVNSSGVSTNGDALDNSTITINGFPSELRGGVGSNADPYVFQSGAGLMVQSTGSSQTYNYHQAMIRESDFVQLSDDINDFNNRYRIAGSAPGSNNDEGDLYFDTNSNKMYVYDGSAWGEVTSTGDFKYLVLCNAGTTNAATYNGSDVSFDLKENTTGGSAASVTNAAQLMVSVNGVVQKPNTGTNTSGLDGFVMTDADTIKFTAGPPANAEVFVVQSGSALSINTPGDATVSQAKIQNGAVDTAQLAADAVDGTRIADNAIDSEHYVDGSIDNAHIADDAIDSEHYAAASIDHEHLADDAVDGDIIADNSVGLAHMAGGTDGQIITYDANGDPLAVGPGTDGQVLTSTGAGSPPAFETISTSDTLSFRNLIVNGAMRIAQRGTTSTSSGMYTVDRYKNQFGGHDEALTQAQVTLTSSDTGPWEKGFRYALQLTNGNQTGGVGATDFVSIQYRTEATDCANSGWDYTDPNSKLTLSFWVKSSVAQNFYGFIQNHESTVRTFSFETGSLSSNTLTKITKVIPGHADLTFVDDNSKGLEITLYAWLGSDYSNNATLNQWQAFDSTNYIPDPASTWWTTDDSTFAITGLQLEVGSTATTFEHRSYGDELDRCYRYYQLWASGDNETIGPGAMYDDDTVMFFIQLTKEMRTTPSCVQTSGTDYYHIQAGTGDHAGQTDGPFVLTISNPRSIRMYNDHASNLSSVTGRACTVRTDNAASSIAFDAEI